MATQTIKIDSVLGGLSETQYEGSNGSFNIGLGIDPDFALSDPDNSGAITAGVRTSGLVMPTRYEKFSSTLITAYPTFLLTNPKDTNVYAITNAGFMVSYNSSLASETAIDTTSITFDAQATGTINAAVTKTVAHTCTGTNLVLIVDLELDNGGSSAFSCTYNGVAMTQVANTSGTARNVVMFYLIAPATGAHNAVASWTGSNSGVMAVRSYTGVHQTTAIGTPVTYASDETTVTSASVVVTSAVGELVVDAICSENNPTVVAGQTARYAATIFTDYGEGSDKTGASSVTMGWTMASGRVAMIGVPLKPIASGSSGNGAVYYNNYMYQATGTDVRRYGPLNGTPSLNTSFWVGTIGGGALINTTYPTVGGVNIPNHSMHVHGDNKLYFCEFNTAGNPGKGVINYIATSKTTDEGDTNNSSTANKLALPFNFLPTDIESYGTDLVISAIQTTSSTVNQGRSALFFWDTTATTFYRGPLYLPDPLVTAMKNVNGELFVWSGNSTRGCRLSKYIGGDSIQEVMFIEDSPPPLSGAVEAWGSRLAWGGSTSYPSTAGVVYSYGSKDQRLGKSLMIPIISTAGSTTPVVTSILNYSHLSFVRPKMIVGWGNGTTYGIDKLSTTATYSSVWRSEKFSIPGKFRVTKLRIPLSQALASNMSIVPKLYFDDFSTSATLATINNTNYPSKKRVIYQAAELNAISAGGNIGYNNLLLEFTFAGTAEIAVNFPIIIEYELFEDEDN